MKLSREIQLVNLTKAKLWSKTLKSANVMAQQIATELTESISPVGKTALVDEDDGRKEGSYDRLIGAVYCNGNTSSLNQILLEEGKARVYEDFCGVSEFSRDNWVTDFGC
jgi:nuclease-like protein